MMKVTSRSSETRTAEVIALLESFASAWNAKDLTQLGAHFTQDAEFTDVTGQSALGKAAIVKQHEYPFEVVNKNAVFTLDNLLIRDLSDDLILVSAQWTTTGSVSPKGAALPDRKGIIQLVCELQNSKWLLKLVYNADVETVFFREDRELRGE